jgi:ribosomal protein S18 acetylase RimI-like enzyme
MYAEDSFIVIKPLDGNSLGDAVRIYNSGSDARYATGLEGNLSIQGLSSLIERTKACNNEFLAGIYEKSSGTGTEADTGTGTDTDTGTLLRFSGLCSGIVETNSLWIKQLSILPESRRKGIGTRAAESLLRFAVCLQNVNDAYLSVVDKNTAGLCFWRKLGFCEVHRLEKVLFGEDRPFNVIIMHKSL